jgi:hypothetical protein
MHGQRNVKIRTYVLTILIRSSNNKRTDNIVFSFKYLSVFYLIQPDVFHTQVFVRNTMLFYV